MEGHLGISGRPTPDTFRYDPSGTLRTVGPRVPQVSPGKLGEPGDDRRSVEFHAIAPSSGDSVVLEDLEKGDWARGTRTHEPSCREGRLTKKSCPCPSPLVTVRPTPVAGALRLSFVTRPAPATTLRKKEDLVLRSPSVVGAWSRRHPCRTDRVTDLRTVHAFQLRLPASPPTRRPDVWTDESKGLSSVCGRIPPRVGRATEDRIRGPGTLGRDGPSSGWQ